jgi:hypothetical protein
MAGLRLKSQEYSILANLHEMVERFNKAPAYLNRVVYRTYQNRQRKRFQTMNVSEGQQWPELNPKYKEWKKKKFASAFGGGTKMMIRTGRLFAAVSGDAVSGVSFDHKKIVTRSKIEVLWSTPYYEYTEDVRPVNVWDKKQDAQMYADYAKYLMGVKK